MGGEAVEVNEKGKMKKEKAGDQCKIQKEKTRA
jgi:hypothetical protein